MPKKNTSQKSLTKMSCDFAMPKNAREGAMALIAAIRSGNPQEARKAAQHLVETAVFMTHLVEMAWYLRPDLVADASKNYPFHPILLATGAGRDTRQKLNRIESLPIGANLPFKRLRGAAKNDALRFWIEGDYEVFRLVRIGLTHLVSPMSPALEQEIKSLPDLSRLHARQWAAAMVRRKSEGPGGNQFPGLLKINLAGETKKRKQRIEDRVRSKFGGTKVDRKRFGSETQFFAHSGDAAKGLEVDAIQATRIEKRIVDAHNLAPTDADQRNSLIDEVEKRIFSMLK